MDSQSKQEPPAFNLPPPPDEASSAPERPVNPLHAFETPPAMPPLGGPSQPDPGPAQSAPAAPLTQQPPAPMQPVAAAPPGGHMPQIADDTDLIEKEWVEKAKQIVEQTAHDPYLQNREINKVKADYLKKRYNKDVKLNEE